ncbi:MAG: hypothetical protein OXN89_06340 [Bryobacterales bacterium]|nr:hypothetical protein [Bryobacterales bacterium]
MQLWIPLKTRVGSLDADGSRLPRAGPTASHEFDIDQNVDQARGLAERIYSIFRWADTDEFLQRYGGEA